MRLCECGCENEVTGVYTHTQTARGVIKGEPKRFLPGHTPLGVFGTGSALDRFVIEERGYKTPCYVWTGPRNQKGYGLVKVGRSSRAAHLVVYENEHGPLGDGQTLDHLCRVRGCIRPDHLEAVVHKVNVRRGSNQKLTRRQVRAIQVAAAQEGATILGLSRRFGISRPTIKTITTGEHWLVRS